jgi:hypothetical protein
MIVSSYILDRASQLPNLASLGLLIIFVDTNSLPPCHLRDILGAHSRTEIKGRRAAELLFALRQRKTPLCGGTVVEVSRAG